MNEPMIRGHVIAHTAEFFRNQCDPTIALRIDGALSFELKAALRDIKPGAWYPRSHQVELLTAVAKAHGSDAPTRSDLLRCGAAMTSGGNEFMRLLLKILTPELFLKKSERFWLRDHSQSGSCELERLDAMGHAGRLRLRGIAGYTHAGIIWLGWIKNVLERVSGADAQVHQQGWTWANPAPDEVVYEVRWL